MISFREYLIELKAGTLQSYLNKRNNPEARKKTALDAITHGFSGKPGKSKHQIHTDSMHRARAKIEVKRKQETQYDTHQKPRPVIPAKTGFRSGAMDDTYGT